MDTAHVDMARFLIRERDRKLRLASEFPELPNLAARFAGEVDAYELALAWLAGWEGYPDRLRFEAALAELVAAIPATALDVPYTPAPEADRAFDADDAVDVRTVIHQAEIDLDPQAVVTDGFRQAELDTQDERMGGWEPRS